MTTDQSRTPTSGAISLRGSGLDLLAAAARFGKLGHQVLLPTDPGDLAGPSTPHALVADDPATRVIDTDPVLTLPAVWRDLFTKSGRPFDPTASVQGLVLTAAPPTRHRFADGSQVDLPTGRGGQLTALTHLVGRPAAERWTALVDRIDDLWQALRQRGLERPRPHPLTAEDLAALWHRVTIADLATDLAEPRLAALLNTVAIVAGGRGPQAPALLATRLTVERTFGRWILIPDPDRPAPSHRPHPGAALVDLLAQRVRDRGARVIDPDDRTPPAVIETLDPSILSPASAPRTRWAGWWGRKPAVPPIQAVPAPRVSHRLVESVTPTPDVHPTQSGFAVQIDHTDPSGPMCRWTHRIDDQLSVLTEHDHANPLGPDLAWGLAGSSFEQWAHRPGVQNHPTLLGASSSAGNEAWGQLLGAALLVYRVHAEQTGANARPDNPHQPQHRRGQVWLGDHITR